MSEYPISNVKYLMSKNVLDIGYWILGIRYSKLGVSKFERGQALVTLLFFTVIGVSVTFAAVMMIIANSLSGMKFQQGSIAYEIAQSGAENAKLRLLRDPSYLGETMLVGSGSAVITVTPNTGNTYTIISRGVQGSFVRQIQIDASYTNNLLQITSQKEIF